MADVFPKFIIEGNNLIIGKCAFHKQLAKDESQVKGGGLWEWDREKKEFKLFGQSDDFGAVTEDDLKACIESGNIFLSYMGGRIIEGHIFHLNVGYEIITISQPNKQSQAKSYPQGGYALGNYYCTCTTCKGKFQGEKHSFQCKPCGTKSQAEWDALTDEQKMERQKRNIEIYNLAMRFT